MKLNDLKPAPGSKHSRRRVGRGLGSGRGKTAGRGQKGQKSRSGFSQGSGWEGGRSRLIMRLPKRGFNKLKEKFQVVNLDRISEAFADGADINAVTLKAAGLVNNSKRPIKLLGDGELTLKNLKIDLDAYSKSAVKAVEAAGGSVVGEAAAEPSTPRKRNPKVVYQGNGNAAAQAAVPAAPKSSPTTEASADTDASVDNTQAEGDQ